MFLRRPVYRRTRLTMPRRWNFPDKLWSRCITTHNTHNKGSCNTWIEYGEEALALEAEWKASRKTGGAHAGLSSTNASYWQKYEAFVISKSQYFTNGTSYRHAISLMHTLKKQLNVWPLGCYCPELSLSSSMVRQSDRRPLGTKTQKQIVRQCMTV